MNDPLFNRVELVLAQNKKIMCVYNHQTYQSQMNKAIKWILQRSATF